MQSAAWCHLPRGMVSSNRHRPTLPGASWRGEELTKSRLTTSREPPALASLLLIRSRHNARRMGVCRCARHGAEKSSSRCARRAVRGSPCAANARDTNDAPPRSSAPKLPPAGGTRGTCKYSLSHLSDRALLRDLAALVAHDRATTARLLAHLAEVDERRLYLPAAYPSMFAYCVHELRLSEDADRKSTRLNSSHQIIS